MCNKTNHQKEGSFIKMKSLGYFLFSSAFLHFPIVEPFITFFQKINKTKENNEPLLLSLENQELYRQEKCPMAPCDCEKSFKFYGYS